jgi:prevent-host-death family protein
MRAKNLPRRKRMESVGIRELKENLSRYLKRVKSGERIIITERKKEVAVLVPRGKDSVEEEVYQLIQSGIADWAGGKPLGMPTRIISRGDSVSDAVIEDRR